MGKLKKMLGAFVHAPERFDTLAERIAKNSERMDAEKKLLEGKIQEVSAVQPQWLIRLVHTLGRDEEALRHLNRVMSVQPTVWGDERRLHLSPAAAMGPCLFNVNSGEITVGDYSFAGSGVSLLAGSHDMRLTGYLRRDAELREGCDITVGKGVWLCSGCTLLGPCTVGDNAVVAAGAVVTPGTEIPASTIWGGVPAKQIGVLDLPEGGENPESAVFSALERGGGTLMTEGWSEKKVFEGIAAPGYYLTGKQGVLLALKGTYGLAWGVRGAELCRVTLQGEAGSVTLELNGKSGEQEVALPVPEGGPGEVRVSCVPENAELFLALQPLTQEAPAEEIPEIPESAETHAEEAEPEEEGRLDMEAIMAEIREEVRKNGPYEHIPDFDRMPGPGRRGDTDAYSLKEEIAELTDEYEIPLHFPDPSRNPAKRAYKKVAGKAAHFATAPLSLKVTETNLSLKTALETAAEVIAKQQKQIDELTEKVNRLEKQN